MSMNHLINIVFYTNAHIDLYT